MGVFWGLLIAIVVLVAVLGVGALVLVKLGVIAHYAVKDETPDEGMYELDQSREAGEG
jgi:hypothetical protein